MIKSPLLSIIIPMYDASSHLPSLFKTLEKVLNKVDIEILLINDGSGDNTLALATAIAAQYSNVILLNKANGGAASARNAGIRAANGEYIAFLDADDRMDFEKLLLLLAKTREQTLDICAFDLRYIDTVSEQKGEGLIHPIAYNTINTGQFYLTQGYQPSSICVFLVKRAFIVDNDLFFQEGITHEDVELSFRWMLQAQKVMFTKEVIYFYYQNPGSVTNQLTAEKKKAYLLDEVTIAALMKAEADKYAGPIKKVIQKNYNSVTWNLLYGIYQDPAMLDKQFVAEIIEALRSKQLYPIKGALKTKFQKISALIMNLRPLYVLLLNNQLQ